LRAADGRRGSQATQFVDALETGPVGAALWRGRAEVSDLGRWSAAFSVRRAPRSAFADLRAPQRCAELKTLEADADLVHFAESLLAGAIGSASARAMVASVAKEEPLSIEGDAYPRRSVAAAHLQPRTRTQVARADGGDATIARRPTSSLQELDRSRTTSCRR
jgi:hypothetical protein